VIAFTFARVSAVMGLKVEDYYPQKKRWWPRLREKNGKVNEMTCCHKLETYLDAYIDRSRSAPSTFTRFLNAWLISILKNRLNGCLSIVPFLISMKKILLKLTFVMLCISAALMAGPTSTALLSSEPITLPSFKQTNQTVVSQPDLTTQIAAAPQLVANDAPLLWDWTYSSTVYSGSGTLSTDGVGNPQTIETFTGTWNGEAITALLAPGNIGGNDNLLAAPPPQLDGSGLSFSTNSDQFNIFRVSAVNYGAFGFNGIFDGGTGLFSATPANTPPNQRQTLSY
jgi:hypothetical protein